MRLVCFGDSWTAGHGVENDIKYKEEAKPPTFIRKLREQNSWPRWLAEKLNCEYVNNGVCGYGNKFIYNELNESLRNGYIQKNDIIIVMFSYPYRYVHHNDETIEIIFQKFEEDLKNTKHFYLNSFYPSFKDSDFDINSLPKYFINPKGSMAEILRNFEIEKNEHIWEYNSISVWNDKKNFYEGDYHPNLRGYQIISDYIYENIRDMI